MVGLRPVSGVAPPPALAVSDRAAVTAQLGRVPRGAVAVAWRCPCGQPGVVTTAPRLEDGTPFPTTYYLTCPRAVKACSVLEAAGYMAELAQQLSDEALAVRYAAAHRAYLRDRAQWAAVLGQDDRPIAQVSAGGMPTRVKCLHALAAHALAAGPGVNPLGDATLVKLGDFWARPCCSQPGSAVTEQDLVVTESQPHAGPDNDNQPGGSQPNPAVNPPAT